MTEKDRPHKKVDESWKAQVNQERSREEGGEVSREIPATFEFLITSLGMEALAALGEIPHPVTQKQELQLPQAKHLIDLLTMLQEKTRGHLTEEESKALEELCYTLKLKYVEKAGRQAGI